MPVPYEFAAATTDLPGSQLDINFSYLLALIETLSSQQTFVATETIADGALVNVWLSSGAFKVRNANGASGRAANGFLLVGVAATETATVYPYGLITGLGGLTPGPTYLGLTPGVVTQVVPSVGSGNYLQVVGFAVSATSAFFQAGILNGPL